MSFSHIVNCRSSLYFCFITKNKWRAQSVLDLITSQLDSSAPLVSLPVAAEVTLNQFASEVEVPQERKIWELFCTADSQLSICSLDEKGPQICLEIEDWQNLPGVNKFSRPGVTTHLDYVLHHTALVCFVHMSLCYSVLCIRIRYSSILLQYMYRMHKILEIMAVIPTLKNLSLFVTKSK